MFRTFAELFCHLPQWVQLPLESQWYEHMSRLDRDAGMTFMNYGWASLDPSDRVLSLLPEDERNRYCIQLYHRVAGAINLSRMDVLEVGCGRGGGASHVMRYLRPRSLTGLDLAANATAFCRQH